MQIGIVGLGRMGGNMARRLGCSGVEVIGFDADTGASAGIGFVDCGVSGRVWGHAVAAKVPRP
jgi:6-phosphogluconate dehydrogenase (decarboxylating)